MLRTLATRFLCLGLALCVAVQLAVPMAEAAGLPCRDAETVMLPGDASLPCPATDAACPGKECLSHAVALPVPSQRIPPTRDIPGRSGGQEAPDLHPFETADDVLRPPET